MDKPTTPALFHDLKTLRAALDDPQGDAYLVARDFGLWLSLRLGIAREELSEDEHNKIGCAAIDFLQVMGLL